ncbi:MAG: TIR domain-containing protein [Fusobacterium sp.]|uniref:TIR domain-containing protein n=1 Tax=Fusobacterium sp. TaxID=68766 RepID=UPI003991F7CD
MKIFVSYSQKIDTWITKLISGLKNKIKKDNLNIEIIWDKTHLKLGNNMHFFMENSIREADKVFIFCDTSYTQKANERSKGVGVETTIITPKMYGKVEQTKFIPVILWDCAVPDYLDGVYGIPVEAKEVTENIIDMFYSVIQEMIKDKQEKEVSFEKINELKKEDVKIDLNIIEEKMKFLVEKYMKEHTATEADIDALFPELNNDISLKENRPKTNIGMPKVEISFKSRDAIRKHNGNSINNNFEKEKEKLTKGIVDNGVIQYIQTLLEKEMFCKFIVNRAKNNTIPISNAILKLDNELQKKVMKNISDNYIYDIQSCRSGWETYDLFTNIADYVYHNSSNENIKNLAYEIIESCANDVGRYDAQDKLERINEEKYL